MHRYREDDECFSLFCKENVEGPDSQRMNPVCNDQLRPNAESASRNAMKATQVTIRKKQ